MFFFCVAVRSAWASRRTHAYSRSASMISSCIYSKHLNWTSHRINDSPTNNYIKFNLNGGKKERERKSGWGRDWSAQWFLIDCVWMNGLLIYGRYSCANRYRCGIAFQLLRVFILEFEIEYFALKHSYRAGRLHWNWMKIIFRQTSIWFLVPINLYQFIHCNERREKCLYVSKRSEVAEYAFNVFTAVGPAGHGRTEAIKRKSFINDKTRERRQWHMFTFPRDRDNGDDDLPFVTDIFIVGGYAE